MKTILEPKKNIARLWGTQRIKRGGTYRMMRYVLKTKYNDKVLLHNAVTGHFVLLSDNEAEMVTHLPGPYLESMQELVINHFLVSEDFDEYKSVNQLRKICQSRSTGDALNHYVILPTTFCNAHCFYCYESDYPRVQMSEDTAKKLVDYISVHRQDKGVDLNWFGGEPLVAIERIDQISKELKKRDIPFKSSMISNGYLFDEVVIEKASNLWNLTSVQITLDGTEETYNRVKNYANKDKSAFRRVLNNIDRLSGRKIQVQIRLNVDFYNKDDIRSLIEELGERYSGNKYISVYLSILFNNQGYEPVHHSLDDQVQLMDVVDEYTNRLVELKLGNERRFIPSLVFSQCMADDQHAIEVQPDGGFCRCEHECVLDSYGNLDAGIVDPQKPLYWKESVERSEHCPECAVYPACYLLKGCMNAGELCDERIRERTEKAHIDQLCSVYQKSLEDIKNEKV